MIVIDASALAEVLLGTKASASVIDRIPIGEMLHAPHLIDVEIAQVVRRLAASRAIDAERGRAPPGRPRRISSALVSTSFSVVGNLAIAKQLHRP